MGSWHLWLLFENFEFLNIQSCMSNFGALTKWEPQLTELDAAAMRNDGAASVSSQGGSSANTETPSPASSTNSGHGDRQKEVSPC